MNLVIWQPYFFPYLGYFQAVHACDRFCFFDDVQFIKRGYIHRNSVFIQRTPHRFTIPLKNASQHKRINEIKVSDDFAVWKKRFFKMLAINYGSTPFYQETMVLVEAALNHDYISDIAESSVRLTSDYLELDTVFTKSSAFPYDLSSSASDKMIALCKVQGSDTLYNAMGGYLLYDRAEFKKHGIELKFFEMDNNRLRRTIPSDEIGLSMMHFLFHYRPEEIRSMLEQWVIK